MTQYATTITSTRRETTSDQQRSVPIARKIVGGFFLVMGGVHLGLVAADADVYRHFADDALFRFVADGWQEIVMARPELYGLLLMAGEIALGTMLLIGGRAAYVGWSGVIAFHVLLLVFGWGIWLWAIPALAVMVPMARRDIRGGCRP